MRTATLAFITILPGTGRRTSEAGGGARAGSSTADSTRGNARAPPPTCGLSASPYRRARYASCLRPLAHVAPRVAARPADVATYAPPHFCPHVNPVPLAPT